MSLTIGHTAVDCTTTAPVHLLGQFGMRVNQGVLDPVGAYATVMEEAGEALLLLLSVDTEEIQPYLVQETAAEIRQRIPEIPVERLIVNATHTHGAGSYLKDDHPGLSEPAQFPHPGIEIVRGDEYRAMLVQRLADAVCAAWRSRRPGGIAYGYGYAVVGHSRRVCYLENRARYGSVGVGRNGTACMYGETNDLQFSHFENGAGDPVVQILFTTDTDRQLTGAVVNISCPYQLDELISETTSSFAHEIREAIQKRHPGVHVLLQSGAGGDVSPRTLYAKAAENRRFRLKYPGVTARSPEWFARLDIAERVLQTFDKMWEWARRDVVFFAPITHRSEQMPLTHRTITDEEYRHISSTLEKYENTPYLAEGDNLLIRNSARRSYLNLCRALAERYKNGRGGAVVPAEVHVASLGEIALVSAPFELYQDYQYRIQARSPFIQTFLVQMANDTLGYVCTERADAGEGYSAGFLNRIAPAGGREYVERVLELLRLAAEKNKWEQ